MRMSPTLLSASILSLPLAYGAGAYAMYKGAWPVSQLIGMAREYRDSSDLVRTDKFGRLLVFPGKTEVPCPAPDATTAVYLVSGQSNAANYQGQKYAAQDDRVLNFSEGRCYGAASPLLGADN